MLDYVPRRPDSAITTLGHSRTRAISKSDPIIYSRLKRGSGGIRYLESVAMVAHCQE